MGDPAGIGPELVTSLLQDGSVFSSGIEWIVYGDRCVLEVAGDRLIETSTLKAITPGRPTAETGRATVACLERAVADAATLDALVTAPISKAACLATGFAFPGHTEFLAARLGVKHVSMMMAGPRLRVTLATTHVGIASVAAHLSVEGIVTTIVHTAESLRRDFNLARPRIAVAGLNPHAGEKGHFGDEDQRLIAPAIELAAKQLPFAEITGPHVPDAVFRHARLDLPDCQFDAVVAMYHDQGLIPVKLIDFEAAVNVTLGLPMVRTSPDHGVAYDLAGTGSARSTSFFAAVRMAIAMVRARQPCDLATSYHHLAIR